MKRTTVRTNSRSSITLSTNDTLTLAFPYREESTPQSLRARVSEQSLRKILRTSTDAHEISKVERALAITLQLGVHGTGRRSAQLFDGAGKLIADYNL